MNKIAEKLFETEAIRVANPEHPFWYTSGKIGPYFINTHFLYGSEKDADELLTMINEMSSTPEKLIAELNDAVIRFFNSNPLYQEVMEDFVNELQKNELFRQCSSISGGERRDWFFSVITAKLTGKKHFYIFKDLSIYDENGKVTDLAGEKVAHIADLVTEASSYQRAWIPAIRALHGTMTFTASIVDRDQGGYEYLQTEHVPLYAPVKIDRDFFAWAVKAGTISSAQHEMILRFTENPDKYGIDFLTTHSQFLKDSLASSDKNIRSKAERCVNNATYGTDFKKKLN